MPNPNIPATPGRAALEQLEGVQIRDGSATVDLANAMPLGTRAAPVQSVDRDARTFSMIWFAGAQPRRYDWARGVFYVEELSTEAGACDLAWLRSGRAPVLNSHWAFTLDDVLGVITAADLAAGQGTGDARLSARPGVEGIAQDVFDGILRNVSVGYIRRVVERVPPANDGGDWRYIVRQWEPIEVSLVPIPLDRGAYVRGPGGRQMGERELRAFPCQFIEHQTQGARADTAAARVEQVSTQAAAAAILTERTQEMPQAQTAQAAAGSQAATESAARADNAAAAVTTATVTVPAAAATEVRATDEQLAAAAAQGAANEAARQAEIRRHCGALSLPDAFAQRMIEQRSLTLDQVRARILEEAAARSDQTSGRSAANVETVQDETDVRREAMANALEHRGSGGRGVTLTDAGRAWRSLSLIEMARESLRRSGTKVDGMSRMEIASRALLGSDEFGFRNLHGTSDFTIALASTVNRTLRRGYESAPQTFRRWARQGELMDFRPASRVAVAGNLGLEKVNEFGEFKRGKLVDAGETIQLATYGKVIGITRQVIVNDDIDMISRLPQMFGRAAADFESDTVYSVLTANAAMADTVALFHASHGNLGTAGAPSETTLSEMRKLVRAQKDPSGNNQPLNLTVAVVIVPAALETTTQKLLQAVIMATKSADTNVFRGAYEMIVEARLDANSATAWYGAADPSVIDTVEYAYLSGQQGLRTDQRVGFDVDGLELKAALDFAAKAIDYRGLFKNAG